MTSRLPNSPTPQNFAAATTDLVSPLVDKLAGADARMTKTEVRDGVARGRITAEESALVAETIRKQLKSSGAARPTANSTVSGIGRRALRAAEKITGGDGRISKADAKKLPKDLAAIFLALRDSKKAEIEPNPAPTPAPSVAWTSTASGQTVDLEGTPAEFMFVGAAVHGLLSSTPSYYSSFADAYRPSAADLKASLAGGQGLIGAAFAASLGVNDWLESSQVNIVPIALDKLGKSLSDMLELHAGHAMSNADKTLTRKNYETLGQAMAAAGATHAFEARYEDSGDYSYLAVVAANENTGDLRVLGFRRDPE